MASETGLSGIADPKAASTLLIFVKNASALLFGFVFGPLLCLVPIITLLTNGLLLSAVSIMVGQEKSFVFLLGGILPHGIFELPAFIIGEAAALSFSVMVIVALVKGELRKRFWPGLKHNARYLVIALALLVPAAVIETFITPLVLAWLMRG